MRKVSRFLVALVLTVFCTIVVGSSVQAEGGWIGSGDLSGGGSGSSSGGSAAPCETLSWPEQAALPRCQGFSWIFYASQAPKASAVEYEFRPGQRVKIPKECAEHTDEGGGFWHLGTNAYSYNYGYTPYNFFDPAGDAGQYDKEHGIGSTYTTDDGYGHSATFTWKSLNNMSWLSYNYHADSELSHNLYYGSTLLYKATKYGSSTINNTNVAWKNFKSAWKAANGTEYTGSSFPDDLYAFCYWPGMDEVPEYKLSISTSNATATVNRTSSPRKNASTGYLKSGDKIYDGDKLTISFSPNSCYKWGKHTVNDTSVNSGYNLTVSKDVSVVASANLKGAKLHIERAAGTTLSVTRNSTLLSDGTAIYCGDTLKTTYSILPGYSWGTHTLNNSNISSGSTYTLKDDNAETDVYVKTTADRNEYAGKSMVASTTGAWSSSVGKSLGFTQSSGRENYYIYNCDPVGGCSVKFWHYLQRKAGSGSVDYQIKRTSNYNSIAEVDTKGTQNFGAGNEILISENTFEKKMKPGQVVCETLTFDANVDNTGVSLKVCAYALGNAQPDDPSDTDEPESPGSDSGDTSFINIKVRNQSVAQYDNYQRQVYAKPGDQLAYRATYYPVLQYTYFLKPEAMQIDGGTVFDGGGLIMGELFNRKKSGSMKDWNNAFSVISSKDGFNNYSYVGSSSDLPGVTERRSLVHTYGTVQVEDVGKSIDEKAITNRYENSMTTPGQINFSMVSSKSTGNVDTSRREKTAFARVPYNFNIDLDISSDTDIAHAGEAVFVRYGLAVNPKVNRATTNGTDAEAYTTRADDVIRELVVYNPDRVTQRNGGIVTGNRSTDICSAYYGYGSDDVNCGYSNVATESLNTGDHNMESEFYAQDLEAGSRVCVAVASFPASSGADTNWNDKNYSMTWRVSDSRCFTIAKRPSLQVWGGNVFTSGGIITGVSAKNNVAGIAEYSISQPKSHSYVFGSWGELGLVALDEVKGFASGASMGYSENLEHNGLLIRNPGGSFETGGGDYCLRSKLTLANEMCASNTVGVMGRRNSTLNTERDINYILNRYATSEGPNVSGTVSLNNESPNYTYSGGSDLRIDTSIVSGGEYLVRSDASVYIDGDLKYSGEYSGINNVPKIIILAKDITISCNVRRVDALMVASGTVKTCDSDDTNSPSNSVELLVNGAIITGKMIANRTYGASTGVNSIIPAELINFDSTLYFLGTQMSDVTRSGKISTVYLHELSPRY